MLLSKEVEVSGVMTATSDVHHSTSVFYLFVYGIISKGRVRMENNRIYLGDNVEFMRENILDKSIDLTVTSPPYDNLRTYNGFTWDFESLAKELYRVTKDGGVVVWVVGDATVKGSETGTSFRQALGFMSVAFNLHDTMIYAKENPIPLTHNRYEQQFEYMFVFSKGKPKVFNPIEVECKTANSTTSKRTFYQKSDDNIPSAGHKNTKVKPYKYKYNIWYYHVGGNKVNHPAVFPEQLANDHIISWSNPGDLIFDPFCGSGTTCKMAKVNGRNYIGIDISQEYVDIANQRIQELNQ